MNYFDKTDLSGFKMNHGYPVEGNGIGLTALLVAGLQQLEQHVPLLNRLNVFPVPDADTGVNLFLTMRAAVNRAVEATTPHAGQTAMAAAKGALLGARGNSGVILSQLLQGIAQHLADRPVFSATDFSAAWQQGVKLAYRGVTEPVEGTILTVSAAAASVSTHTNDLVTLLETMLHAAQIAQANTPNLLPVLKEAGVTDAGGQGLVSILTGMVQYLTGQPAINGNGQPITTPAINLSAVDLDYGYDVQFLLHGLNLDVAEIRADIDRMGESTIVAGDSRLVKVHVHTTRPGQPLSYGAQRGDLTDVVVEDMTLQVVQRRTEQSPVTNSGVQIVAMAPGRGFVDIFESLGIACTIVNGHQHQPDFETIRAVLAGFASGSIVVLPDSPTRLRVAYQAAQTSKANLYVIPTRSVVQGVSAALAFNPHADIQTNVERMSRAVTEVHTLTIVRAGRSTVAPGWNVRAGDFLAMLDGRLVAVAGQRDTAALDSFGIIDMVTVEVVSLYVGRAVEPASARQLAATITERYPHVDVEVHHGDQLYYEYIISLE